ncbi:hypothetical protein [Amycolatopsis samaneae]|uniref:DUF2017 domain-containing protein n=1 Tax=Amycolatopsis samaneae TaxID=664691 RepID=A0ABW5GLB3_9PSEU
MDGDNAARREVLWDRCGESVIGIFTPHQAQVLRERLADYRRRVERALESLHDDAVISALLTTETDRLRVKLELTLARIAFFLHDLPDHGGVVELHDYPHRMEWIWMLQELRIAAASAAEGGPRPLAEPGAECAEFVEWSFTVIAGMIAVSEQEPPPELPEPERDPWPGGEADVIVVRRHPGDPVA